MIARCSRCSWRRRTANPPSTPRRCAARWTPPHAHNSIADVVLHCAYWKYISRRRLAGGRKGGFEGSFSVKGSDWFETPTRLTPSEWNGYLALLDDEHEQLLGAVRNSGADLRLPAARRHVRLLFGLAMHDAYHTGQVKLLRAMHKRATASRAPMSPHPGVPDPAAAMPAGPTLNRAMRIGVITQARMGSARLPGKVLREAGGRPLLAHHVDRLTACREPDRVVVATSTHGSDDPIEAWCRSAGVRCRRGALDDVAARFAQVAQAEQLDAFVRVCADSPLIDPALVDRATAAFRADPVDVVTNLHPRTWPPGQSVEVVDTRAFLRAAPRMDGPDDREHVTRWFYRHASNYRVHNLTSDRDYNGLRMAVDTPEDLDWLDSLLVGLDRPLGTYGLDELADRLRAPAH